MAPWDRNGSSPRGTQRFVWQEQISAWMLGQVHHIILSFFLRGGRLATCSTGPANSIGMKIWQCYNNLPAQAWHYSNNDKLSLNGNGLSSF
jgi:hypothetical protein